MDDQKKPNRLLFLIPLGCCVLLIVLVLTLSGCQTASIDDLGVGAPQPLTTSVTTPAEKPATVSVAGTVPDKAPSVVDGHALAPRNEGVYPKIGNVPVGETAQLTKSDTASIRRSLAAASKKVGERGKGEQLTQYQKEMQALRKRARRHDKDALKKIEASGS